MGFFYGGLWLIIGGLRWWVCTLQWISEFSFLFFSFSFYVVPNTVKYFSDYFLACNQTQEKKSFSLKSFIFANILWWKMIYSETNGA